MELYNKLLYISDEEDDIVEEKNCFWKYVSYVFRILHIS